MASTQCPDLLSRPPHPGKATKLVTLHEVAHAIQVDVDADGRHVLQKQASADMLLAAESVCLPI